MDPMTESCPSCPSNEVLSCPNVSLRTEADQLKVNAGGKWVCENCGKEFVRKYNLQRHLSGRCAVLNAPNRTPTHVQSTMSGPVQSDDVQHDVERDSECVAAPGTDFPMSSELTAFRAEGGERAIIYSAHTLSSQIGVAPFHTDRDQEPGPDSVYSSPWNQQQIRRDPFTGLPVTPDQPSTLGRTKAGAGAGGPLAIVGKNAGGLVPILPDRPPYDADDNTDQKLGKLRQEILDKLLVLEGKKKVGTTGGPTGTDKGKDEDEEKKIDIVCLAKGDYLKKLIQLHDGDEEKAMNYIKNVGIATDFLEGDFRMIKKIYFDGKKKSEFPIRVKDFKRNKLEYLEENGEWILDIRGEIVGKRLCDNIVKTLLIANSQFNDVIIKEMDEEKKALLLDLFQINKTQAHILKLTERKTQCKLSHRVAEFINYCTEVQAETGSLDNVEKAYGS